MSTPPQPPPPGGTKAWLAAATVAADIYALRPDYHTLIATARNLQPGPSDDASDELMSRAEAVARVRLAHTSIHDLEAVHDWRATYQAFGAKPQRTRPSLEALLGRISVGLPRIDRITDTYNAVSVTHLLPVGGEDLLRYDGPAALRRATGDETFDTTSNGIAVTEHPTPGEVIWCDDAGVTCRRWNWRQCNRTRITPTSTAVVFILDALGTTATDTLHAAEHSLLQAMGRLHPAAQFDRRLLSPP